MEYLKKSNSAVRKHFLREERGQTMMCKYTDCKKVLKIVCGSTKGLHTHLLTVHKINLTPATISANTSDEPPTKKKKNVNPIIFRYWSEKKNHFLLHLHDKQPLMGFRSTLYAVLVIYVQVL